MIQALALIIGFGLFIHFGGEWAVAISCAIGGGIWTYLFMKD